MVKIICMGYMCRMFTYILLRLLNAFRHPYLLSASHDLE
jgi:hypothetical protein